MSVEEKLAKIRAAWPTFVVYFQLEGKVEINRYPRGELRAVIVTGASLEEALDRALERLDEGQGAPPRAPRPLSLFPESAS